MVGAEWDPAANGGLLMSYQGLHFDGLPGDDTTAFTLGLGERGEINSPFVFQVNIPQAEETD